MPPHRQSTRPYAHTNSYIDLCSHAKLALRRYHQNIDPTIHDTLIVPLEGLGWNLDAMPKEDLLNS